MGTEFFNDYVKALSKNLHKPLPGEDSQRRMAPAVRARLMSHSKPDEKTRLSAVLLPIFPKDGDPTLVFIKRQTYDGYHSGQIAFPGGKKEKTDSNLLETALRETWEEVGIVQESVTILGTLTPLFIPVSNHLVLPVVGVVWSKPKFFPNLQEVEYIIEVPICRLVQPDTRTVKTLVLDNEPVSTPYFKYDGEMIWGATAMILAEFTDISPIIPCQSQP